MSCAHADRKRYPTSSLDVEVLLSELVGGIKTLKSAVEIYKEKNKPTCLVKPKHRLRSTLWNQINNQVREWGGLWRRAQQMWDIPLERES